MKNLTKASLMTALTFVGAQVSIPLWGVPFTLQVLFVLLSGFLLEPKWAALSMGTYLAMGAAGLPVFASFSGGLAHLLGPTGGYLLSFPLASFIASTLKKRSLIIASLTAMGVVYLVGWAWLGMWLGNWVKAFRVGVIPFVPLDTIKAMIAAAIARRAEVIVCSRSST